MAGMEGGWPHTCRGTGASSLKALQTLLENCNGEIPRPPPPQAQGKVFPPLITLILELGKKLIKGPALHTPLGVQFSMMKGAMGVLVKQHSKQLGLK